MDRIIKRNLHRHTLWIWVNLLNGRSESSTKEVQDIVLVLGGERLLYFNIISDTHDPVWCDTDSVL